MNIKLARLPDVQEPAREADVFDKTLYANAELLKLAGRFTNATRAIEAARAIQDFHSLCDVYKDARKIITQASGLLDGIERAIETEIKQRN